MKIKTYENLVTKNLSKLQFSYVNTIYWTNRVSDQCRSSKKPVAVSKNLGRMDLKSQNLKQRIKNLSYSKQALQIPDSGAHIFNLNDIQILMNLYFGITWDHLYVQILVILFFKCGIKYSPSRCLFDRIWTPAFTNKKNQMNLKFSFFKMGRAEGKNHEIYDYTLMNTQFQY